jgi:hypothetical protein
MRGETSSGSVAGEKKQLRRFECGGVRWLLFLLLPPICFVLLSTSSFSLFLFVLFVFVLWL